MATIPSWIDGKWTLLQQLNACIDRIKYLETITATKEELTALNSVLTALSNTVNAIENSMVTDEELEGYLGEIDTVITNLSNTVTNLSSDISDISLVINTLQNKKDGLTDIADIELLEENGTRGNITNNKITLEGNFVATRPDNTKITKHATLFLPVLAGTNISFDVAGNNIIINSTGSGSGGKLYMHTTKFTSRGLTGWVIVTSINSNGNAYSSNQDVFTYGGVINGSIYASGCDGLMAVTFSNYQGDHYTIAGIYSDNGVATFGSYILNKIAGTSSAECRFSSDVVEEL